MERLHGGGETMDTIIGQETAVNYLKAHITTPPHILLYGPTGVGKSMLGTAWIKEQLLSQGIPYEEQKSMILNLNSTEERGIAVVRQRLLGFIRGTHSKPGTIAWVLLDDAENLPVATQQALRRILELYMSHVRFCLITKDLNNIIEPIQSRCVLIALNPVAEASACRGDYRQWQIQQLFKQVSTPLVNPDTSASLTQLIEFIQTQNITGITREIILLWQKGLSFEDCLAMIEKAVPCELLSICGECHIAQIQGNTTIFDLIAVLSGKRSIL
jgi:replication factor C small subunit